MSRHDKTTINYNETFTCGNCGRTISPPLYGSEHRNHCPHCLWSRHMDLKIGDRRSACRGMMEPVSIWVRKNKEWAVMHHCSKCGFIRSNRIAGDDNEVILFTLASKAITMMPFPAEKMLNSIQNKCVNGVEL